MIMQILKRFVLLLLACLTGTVTAAPEERAQAVNQFVDEMVQKHGFERAELMQLMAQTRFRHDIIKAMNRPAEGKPWHQYRPIFVTLARSRAGVQFWRDNEELLARAEREYGVPAQIIVAIIGVETRYGGYIGKHRVLDALSTLAFGYPKRAEFFRKQLEEYLLLVREESLEIDSTVGSYAGAMGMPQFIPSSYRVFAVDFDGDGRRDLWNSTADVIGSVAHYFQRHGWRQGAAVAFKASSNGEDVAALVDAGMKPSLTIAELRRGGITVDAALADDELASLIQLEQENGYEYWLGLSNFYTITRYNHSNLYAMAVYQLSNQILDLRAAAEDSLVSR
jgi:membrane-bound lytic murein transglycosylase B